MDAQGQNGLLSTYRESWRTRGAPAWLIAVMLTLLYVVLFFEETLWRGPLHGTPSFTALAHMVGLPSRWLLYALLYSAAMSGGAIYYLRRHGNSRYNRARITVNVVIQVLLVFTLPFVMVKLGQRDYYFSHLWPLNYTAFFPDDVFQYPPYIVVYSFLAALVAAPMLALVYGKRWYCSWVCSAGGLANTFGDPWRHLTSKTTRSWRFESLTVHLMLVLAVVVTALVFIDFGIGDKYPELHREVGWLRHTYAFFVGAVLAGVVGLGAFPILGPRVWCRNFCPMGAMLGLLQKLGRFRIRVKPDMCISCGNCTTYCEMGIDVRAYAQQNQSFTRASCVGCGTCAHVCPRGVLKLETVPLAQRHGSLPVLR